tara:strand:+ start:172 stop:768 length:597 start_codon:yes stop_codon:yes gene_type:complete
MGSSDSKPIRKKDINYYPDCHENINKFKTDIKSQTDKIHKISECIMNIEQATEELHKLNKDLIEIKIKIRMDLEGSEMDNFNIMKKIINNISKQNKNIEENKNNVKYYWSNLLIDINNGKYLHCLHFIKSWVSDHIVMDGNISKPKRSYKKPVKNKNNKNKKPIVKSKKKSIKSSIGNENIRNKYRRHNSPRYYDYYR